MTSLFLRHQDIN